MSAEVKERPTARTRVSRKNQVTLPVAALAEAHVRPGDVLRVEVVADGVFRLVRERSRLDGIIGIAPGLSAATDLQALRDEWDRDR
ncbi:MAG TPA: AbrB/MazE/SpoVT family DNA-binding domain-containing protein [Cryptosporangiaceae bacterium]|nr:AbrB/MazE/SpoVT family DNA-binding domain-containing protein [Cryptosporangiaceae bacterium]